MRILLFVFLGASAVGSLLAIPPVRAAAPVNLFPGASASSVANASARPAPKLHADLCANCHGGRWEGGRAPSMLDDVWAHGGEDEDLTRSIRDGWPANAMPAFGTVLSPLEIRALVIHIREARDKAHREPLPPPRPLDQQIIESELHRFKIEVVAKDLRTPWGIAFLPDGHFLVSERAGNLKIVDPARGVIGSVSGLPKPWVKQDGGFFDVAVHPDYARNGWVYLSYSEAGPVKNTSTTRVIRGRIRDGKFIDQETLFQAAPEFIWESNIHYGSRFLFDRAGYLYFSIGDRGHRDDAQNLASPYGKLHRVHDDGRVPADNPFVDRPGAVKSIWSYGHRNQQGLAQHPITGEIWATEHGPRGGDELNRILPGHNYGWPVITYGMNDDGSPITDLTAKEGMDQPVVYWTPSIAVAALQFYTGTQFPRWKNQLFVAALAGRQLRRLERDGSGGVRQEIIFHDLGRVREVTTGSDGYLYIALNAEFGDSPGQIIRLVPAETP